MHHQWRCIRTQHASSRGIATCTAGTMQASVAGAAPALHLQSTACSLGVRAAAFWFLRAPSRVMPRFVRMASRLTSACGAQGHAVQPCEYLGVALTEVRAMMEKEPGIVLLPYDDA
jgi:hypothetical protein